MSVSDDLISSFRQFLFVERRSSPNTVSCYVAEIRRYIAFLEGRGHQADAVDVDEITEYLGFRSKDGKVGTRTVSRIITILRVFYVFLIQSDIMDVSPLELIGQIKVEKPLPKVLKTGEVDAILDTMDVTTPLGLRDRTLFEAIYSCGLRVSEATALRVQDYDCEQGVLSVIGKGDKQRIVLVGTILRDLLSRYMIESRPVLVNDNPRCRFLFVGRRGERLTRALVWKRFKAYCADCGKDAKVHTLRHSFATHLLQGGADLRVVQELLGHSDIRTTQVYTHVDTDQLQSEFNKHHPDGGGK
ncbi:MAG: tyrosine recombinase [Sphaerochaetaceae bacterium]|jgi:integrase/recombinase XerD|nr:tyrosine recombinase [Sphaerochaetaceae bacterium]NLY06667.1 tyrosine recombinase [Spirochaetales bacterium]